MIDDFARSLAVADGAGLRQLGEPALFALEADHPPLRLLLGEGALQVARGRLDALERDFAAWEHLSLSTELTA